MSISNSILSKTAFFLLAPTIIVFVVLWKYELYDNALQLHLEVRTQKLCQPWFLWQQSYRNCLVNFMKTRNPWTHINEGIANCLGQTQFEHMNVKLLHNFDDTKLVITPYSNSTPCTELTLGIGNDIEAEKQLLQLVPHCKLYGADPILQSGKIFGQIGKYYEVAVSGHNGIFKSSVLANGTYSAKEVLNVDFIDFILNNVSQNTFDYLFMDNEGSEYELLPMFLRGGLIESNEITICQISAELHYPFELYGTNETKVNALLKNLLELSPLLPFWSNRGYHLRLFLFNVENEYCVENFLQPWCHSIN